jgi:hypothetical protein
MLGTRNGSTNRGGHAVGGRDWAEAWWRRATKAGGHAWMRWREMMAADQARWRESGGARHDSAARGGKA